MTLSKFQIAIVAVVAVGLLLIEREHRIVIATPAAAQATPPAAAVCPDTDIVPFSPACIAFIDGGAPPDMHSRLIEAVRALVASSDASRLDAAHAPACPASNENAPYTASCIKFMSGWFWQADPTKAAH